MTRDRATITDVAREAGVSIATVSRVMGQRGSVSPELAQRVRAAAARLGYEPSWVARGLATGETGMVGVLVPQLTSPYFHELIKAIGIGAARDGYHMLVLESDDRPEAEAELAASLYAHVDGVILCSPRMPEEDLQRLAAQRPRLLCLNRLPSSAQPMAIAHDTYGSMTQICHLVRRLGHRRVAFLAGSPDSWAGRQRWQAVQDSAGIGLDPVHVQSGTSLGAGYAAVDTALAHQPTALLGTSDPTAIGALARLRELGRRVPEEISITGFGDILYSRYTCPPLTTITVHRPDIGARAWDIMGRLLAGEAALPPGPLLAGGLVIRDSTGPPPGDDAGPSRQ